MTLHIGTILIAKEDGNDYTKGGQYAIIDQDRSINTKYKIESDNALATNWLDEGRINQHFTIKRYTLTDLKERKIAVKLRNYDEYKRLCEAVGDKFNDKCYYSDDFGYYGIDDNESQIDYMIDNDLVGRILLESIDEIALGEENEEVKEFINEPFYIQKLEEQITRLKGELDKSQEAGRCIAEKLADEMKEKVSYMEEVNRLKGENESLTSDLNRMNMESEIVANQYSGLLTDIAQLKLQLKEQSTPDLEKRERMAWELFVKAAEISKGKHIELTIDDCFEYVDELLAKSKEVGNG